MHRKHLPTVKLQRFLLPVVPGLDELKNGSGSTIAAKSAAVPARSAQRTPGPVLCIGAHTGGQIFLQYAQEIPYSCTVTISSFKEEEKNGSHPRRNYREPGLTEGNSDW